MKSAYYEKCFSKSAFQKSTLGEKQFVLGNKFKNIFKQQLVFGEDL